MVSKCINLLLSHGEHDRHHQLLPFSKPILDLAKKGFMSWELEVIFGVTIISQQIHLSDLANTRVPPSCRCCCMYGCYPAREVSNRLLQVPRRSNLSKPPFVD